MKIYSCAGSHFGWRSSTVEQLICNQQVAGSIPIASSNGEMKFACPTASRCDGSEVVVAKEKLLPKIQKAIDDLNREQVALILLLCVGEFPQFRSTCLVVEPQKIVDHCIQGLIGASHRLGIVIPIAEQEDWVRETFSKLTSAITVAVASPYGGEADLIRAAKKLSEAACDLIVMYCMGFNRQLTRPVREITAKPVIVSSAIVARTVGELLE